MIPGALLDAQNYYYKAPQPTDSREKCGRSKPVPGI
jgi:hypothetical protein